MGAEHGNGPKQARMRWALREVRSVLTLGIMLLVYGGCATVAGQDIFQSIDNDQRAWTPQEWGMLKSGYVNWQNAAAPLTKYVLISEGDFLCGIRFVNFRRGQDKTEGSVWSSGDETLFGAYEWYVFAREGARVRIAEQGKRVVQRSALRGFGHFVIAGGHENVQCGNRQFGWQYPAGIVFSQVPNSDRKIAPTRWEQASDIDLNDPKLVWYSFDQKREPKRIPLEQL